MAIGAIIGAAVAGACRGSELWCRPERADCGVGIIIIILAAPASCQGHPVAV